MKFLRVGMLMFLALRILLLWPKLFQRFSGKPLAVPEGNCAFRIIRSKRDRAVQAVQVGIPVNDKIRFQIHPETKFDVFAKALGLAREWQTGDHNFDARAFIIGDDPVLLDALSSNERLRAQVLDLTAAPIGGVLRCSHGYLSIELPLEAEARQEDEAFAQGPARRVLPALLRIRDTLGTLESALWQGRRDPGIRAQTAILTVTFMLGVAGIVAFLYPTMLFPLQVVFEGIALRSAWLTAICIAALTAATLLLLGKRSRVHWVLLEIFLVGGPAVWLISYAVATTQNQKYDLSRPETHEIRVVRKYYTTGRRRSKTHYIVVERWPDARADNVMHVTSSEYRAIHPPTCFRVRWHRGHLGDPWISEIEPMERDCKSRVDGQW